MTPFKIVLTGALAGLCLATAVQAADYREEPYAEVETRYRSRLVGFHRRVVSRPTSMRSGRISDRVMSRSRSMAALCQTGATGAVRLLLARGVGRARIVA
jgi:hypothetical protein